jgi:hypothetical protein
MGFSKLFLFVLRLAVYPKSSFLCMVLVSLYGLTFSIGFPARRMNAMKSLVRYGVEVVQKRMRAPAQEDA